MTRRSDSRRVAARMTACDARARARRIERLRMQRSAQVECDTTRTRRLAQLCALHDTLATGRFSEAQLFEARAQLLQQSPDAPQGALPLDRHA